MMDVKDKHSVMLIQLVLMFQTAALQQMGKLKNPITDKVEQDLSQAQMSIDMLDMIHAKMRGNLTEDEERMFVDVLRELRLNYVDEVTKKQASDSQASASQSPTSNSTPQA